jgi:hypothetical protein
MIDLKCDPWVRHGHAGRADVLGVAIKPRFIERHTTALNVSSAIALAASALWFVYTIG